MTDGQQKRNLDELLARLLETTERLEERVARLEGTRPAAEIEPRVEPPKPPPLHVPPPAPAPFVAPPVQMPVPPAEPVPVWDPEERARVVTDLHSAELGPVPPAASPAEAFAEFGHPPPGAPPEPRDNWEVRIGTYWLPRVAVVFLAFALVLAAQQYFRGPYGRVLMGYGLSLALIIVGLFKEKKYPMWARPVLAAGLAFSYFTTFALGFVKPMQVIHELPLKIGLLALNVGAILTVAHWKRSEAIAGMALLLGYLTTGLTGDGEAARYATLGLSVVAMLFMLINRWIYSTALAAAATYAAHLYAFKFVQPNAETPPAELFWQHGAFLACYFGVFVAASLFGRNRSPEPRGDAEEGSWSADALPLLVQINLAAFLGSMIHLYWDTGVYWHRIEYFLFGYSAVVFGLSLLFFRKPVVQAGHLVAGSVALAFGIVAAVTPMWMPLALGVQAVGMLRLARYRQGGVWACLSLLALVYAGLSLGVDAMRGRDETSLVTFAGFAALLLAFTWGWVRWVRGPVADGTRGIEYVFPIMGSLVLSAGAEIHLPEQQVVHLLLGCSAAVAALAVTVQFRQFFLFVIGAAVCTVPAFFGGGPLPQGLLDGAVAAGCLTAGLMTEKLTPGKVLERYAWRALYLWGAMMLAAAMPGKFEDGVLYFALLGVALVSGGYLVRSAALVKTAALPAALAVIGLVDPRELIHAKYYTTAASLPEPLLIFALVLGVALAIANPAWYRRTGEWRPEFAGWVQVLLVLAACGAISVRLMDLTDWHISVLAGLATLVALLGAWLDRKKLYLVTTLLLAAAGMAALMTISPGAGSFNHEVVAFDGLVTAFLMVAIERMIAWRELRTPVDPLRVQGITIGSFRALLAVVSLVFGVIMIQFHPSIQVFYFTGALVGLAFVWLVFGFWFGENSYRQAGFGALCLGILKGFVWDVLSLKEPMYRIASWAALGVIAIAASFLYNRFRGRLNQKR